MTDRTALLEAGLDSLPDGVALLDREGAVVLWNQAAEAITGYPAAGLLGRAVPAALQPLLHGGHEAEAAGRGADRAVVVRARHQLGHDLPVVLRVLALRDGLGGRLGAAILFHPAERLDALPHGESDTGRDVEASQADLNERLQAEFEDFERGGEPLGVVWVGVDQGPELRKTHGAAACKAMVDKVRRALAAGLRPAEELGRWGDHEFLVIAHERTAEMLACHARTLAGLARTADFRWWGDRVSLTVSMGAAQAEPGEGLPGLLERARQAMEDSMRDGGNKVTPARKASEETLPAALPGGRA